MKEQRIRFIIDKKGNYTMEAVSGFEGTECVDKTQSLELVLGGQMVASGKKPEYYDPGAADPVKLNL